MRLVCPRLVGLCILGSLPAVDICLVCPWLVFIFVYFQCLIYVRSARFWFLSLYTARDLYIFGLSMGGCYICILPVVDICLICPWLIFIFAYCQLFLYLRVLFMFHFSCFIISFLFMLGFIYIYITGNDLYAFGVLRAGRPMHLYITASG